VFHFRAAEQVPAAEQARFVEVVETEIMSLHEGNIARYRLRPARSASSPASTAFDSLFGSRSAAQTLLFLQNYGEGHAPGTVAG